MGFNFELLREKLTVEFSNIIQKTRFHDGKKLTKKKYTQKCVETLIISTYIYVPIAIWDINSLFPSCHITWIFFTVLIITSAATRNG